MAPSKMIKELDTIIAYADGLKDMATRLRSSAARIYEAPTPKGVTKKKPLSKAIEVQILMKRRKSLKA